MDAIATGGMFMWGGLTYASYDNKTPCSSARVCSSVALFGSMTSSAILWANYIIRPDEDKSNSRLTMACVSTVETGAILCLTLFNCYRISKKLSARQTEESRSLEIIRPNV